MQWKCSFSPFIGAVLSICATGKLLVYVSGGHPGDAPTMLYPLGPQGEWIPGGWSLPGTESGEKPHSNLPGSPPTQTPALPEGAGFPRCPRGLSVSSWAFSLVFDAGVTQMLPAPPPAMARKLCTWASSQDAEDLCFSRSFINLATYGSILRASPPPPPPPPPPPASSALPSPPQNAGAGPGLSLAPCALHAGFVHPWGETNPLGWVGW